jgi:hypothetical protein
MTLPFVGDGGSDTFSQGNFGAGPAKELKNRTTGRNPRCRRGRFHGTRRGRPWSGVRISITV